MKILHRFRIIKGISVEDFNHALDRGNRGFQLMRSIGDEAFLHSLLFHCLSDVLKYKKTAVKPAIFMNRHGQALKINAISMQVADDRIFA